jgi:DNA-binding NarL/FixJ family response regulator
VSNESSDEVKRQLRVVVAEDDIFTLSLVCDGLRAEGYDVSSAETPDEAWQHLQEVDPHALVTDLNFANGGSGAELLHRVNAEFPWIGLVVLTSHHSPELAVADASELPSTVVYMVKSQLKAIEQLSSAIELAISGQSTGSRSNGSDDGVITITSGQADVLRMLAAGASTRALAEHRGTTVRAAETMLARLYDTLGLKGDDSSNPRVTALKMWQDGRVAVK